MNASAPGRPAPLDYALLAFIGVAWGSSFLFIELALRSFAPLTLAALRIVTALTLLWTLVLLSGQAVPHDRRSWIGYALIGATNSAIPFFLISTGQQSVDSSLAAILMVSMPLFTLVLAHLFTNDRATPRKFVGAAIGFVGVLLLFAPAIAAGLNGGLVGQLMVVGGSLSFAVMQVIAHRFKGGTPVVNATCSFSCSALPMIALAVLLERPFAAAVKWESALGMAALGTISTALPFVVLFVLIRRTGPNFVVLNNFLAPPTGILWGVALLGEVPHWTAYVALVVILSGIAVATSAPRRAAKA